MVAFVEHREIVLEHLIILYELLRQVGKLKLAEGLLSLDGVYLLYLIFCVADHVVAFAVQLREPEFQAILVV